MIIKLNNDSRTTVVDDEDYNFLTRFQWSIHESGRGYWYAESGGLKMHRLVLELSYQKTFVDHINRNTLDNRKSNLRLATRSVNAQNSSLRIDNTSGFRGVTGYKGNWLSRISFNGKRYNLGRFKTANEAAMIYDKAAFDLYGANAQFNFPDDISKFAVAADDGSDYAAMLADGYEKNRDR